MKSRGVGRMQAEVEAPNRGGSNTKGKGSWGDRRNTEY